MIPIAEPFCDNLRLSFPLTAVGDGEPEIIPTVLNFLQPVGLTLRPDGKAWDAGAYGGVIFSGRKFSVHCLEFSGAALRSIREADLFFELVELLANTVHTVTRLDATADFPVPAPEYLSKLYYRIRRAPIRIGRKQVSYRDVERYTSVNAEGQPVHNLYLGGRQAQVRVLVYDKRHELATRHGINISGDLLRIEVRLHSQVGCTVWDAYSPERVFYHYAAPDLVSVPASVRSWGAYGQGFRVERKPAHSTPYARMISTVEESATIKALIRLAHEKHSGGFKALVTLLERAYLGKSVRSGTEAPSKGLVVGLGRDTVLP